MNIYLAARYGRRRELVGYANELYNMGHRTTSRWLDGEHEADDNEPTEAQMRRWALDDIADIHAAEMLIAFTEEPRAQMRGGRHVEYGLAVGIILAKPWLHRPIAVVGPVENIFYALPAVERYLNWGVLASRLAVGVTARSHGNDSPHNGR